MYAVSLQKPHFFSLNFHDSPQIYLSSPWGGSESQIWWITWIIAVEVQVLQACTVRTQYDNIKFDAH